MVFVLRIEDRNRKKCNEKNSNNYFKKVYSTWIFFWSLNRNRYILNGKSCLVLLAMGYYMGTYVKCIVPQNQHHLSFTQPFCFISIFILIKVIVIWCKKIDKLINVSYFYFAVFVAVI